MLWAVTPDPPYPVFFTDELDRQPIEGAELGELRGIALQQSPITRNWIARALPPAKFQVNADQLHEQRVSL